MTVLRDYPAQLSQAAERLAAREASTRRRGRIIALSVVGALVLGGAAAGATGLWDPQLGDDRRGHPTASGSAPPAEQIERFGVLRRDPTDADHAAQARYALSMLGPHDVRGIRTDYVRLIRTRADGLGDVLVPAASARGKSDALCLFLRDPAEGGGVSCFTTHDIVGGRAVMMAIQPLPAEAGGPTVKVPRGSGYTRAPDPAFGTVTFAGLVPDGVAQVRLGGVTADVHDNFYALRQPGSHRPGDPSAIDWLDANGKVVPKGTYER